MITAAILRTTGAPLSIEDRIEIPLLREGQVLVEILYSGVCQSQLMEARGLRGLDPHLPHMLGHEGSGRVMETGQGVTKVQVGQSVILGWIRGSGADIRSTRYRRDGDVINAGAVTTFSTMAVVSENRCVPLPDGVPPEIGTLFGCAVLTGVGIAEREVDPQPGSTIAVIGLGGIGLSALIGCTLRSPKALIAVDRSKEKLALARRLGASHVVDAANEDAVAAIRDITAGGADYAIEAAGLTSTIEQAFASIHRGGLCVFASHPASGEMIRIDPYELIAGKRIRGSWGGAARPDEDVPRLAAAFRDGRLDLSALIGRRYPLAAVNEALDDLEQGRVVRPLLAMADRV